MCPQELPRASRRPLGVQKRSPTYSWSDKYAYAMGKSSPSAAAAMDKLYAGRKHFLFADIPLAVSALAEACELLSHQFGKTAVECAEAYFYYGKALLELSRLEAGVLGNALKGVPDQEDAKENSQVEDPEKLTGKF